MGGKIRIRMPLRKAGQGSPQFVPNFARQAAVSRRICWPGCFRVREVLAGLLSVQVGDSLHRFGRNGASREGQSHSRHTAAARPVIALSSNDAELSVRAAQESCNKLLRVLQWTIAERRTLREPPSTTTGPLPASAGCQGSNAISTRAAQSCYGSGTAQRAPELAPKAGATTQQQAANVGNSARKPVASDLAAVETRAHRFAKPGEPGQVLFHADAEDEFKVLDESAGWVTYKCSGISRMIRRSDLEVRSSHLSRDQSTGSVSEAGNTRRNVSISG
jgi:hypothetical protein